MIGDDFKSNTFSANGFKKIYEADKANSNPYFNLHGGIQFELETIKTSEITVEYVAVFVLWLLDFSFFNLNVL